MNKIQLEIEDLLVGLGEYNKINKQININLSFEKEEETTSPIVEILFYNQIISIDKNNLEQKKHLKKSIFNAIIESKSALLLKALIELDLFKEEFTEESKWVISNIENISLSVARTIYFIEKDSLWGNIDKINSNHNTSTYHILKYINSAQDYCLLDKYFNSYGKIKEKQIEIVNCVELFILKDYMFAEYLTNKLKEYGSNINEYPILNNILFKNSTKDVIQNTSIHVGIMDKSKIYKMLNLGYKFNEEKISHNGDNLFLTIIKTDNLDLIRNILPTLNKIEPLDGDWERQELCINNITNVEIKKIVNIYYYKLKLSVQLAHKEKNKLCSIMKI